MMLRLLPGGRFEERYVQQKEWWRRWPRPPRPFKRRIWGGLGVYAPLPRRASGDSHAVYLPRGSDSSFESRPKLVQDCSGELANRLPTKEGAMKQTFAVAIGGAAGQGVATPGGLFDRCIRRSV